MTPTASESEYEELQPFELADLLRIDRADAGLLTSAPVRLPPGWADKWRSRRGAMELTVAEVAFLVGRNPCTVQRWCQGKACGGARLAARRSGPHLYRISPAALVAHLRAMAGGAAPAVVETPTQRDRRARSDKEAAAALCGTGRPKPKAA